MKITALTGGRTKIIEDPHKYSRGSFTWGDWVFVRQGNTAVMLREFPDVDSALIALQKEFRRGFESSGIVAVAEMLEITEILL